MINKLYLITICFAFTCSQLMAQTEIDSNSFPYKKSVVFFLSDFAFEGGFGTSVWINQNYSIVFGINGYSKMQFDYWRSSSSGTIEVDKRDTKINPLISFRWHIFTKQNVTPFLGLTCRPEWHVGEYNKNTYLSYGTIVGVESWLTDNISITGEHAFLYSQALNMKWDNYRTEGHAILALSLYF